MSILLRNGPAIPVTMLGVLIVACWLAPCTARGNVGRGVSPPFALSGSHLPYARAVSSPFALAANPVVYGWAQSPEPQDVNRDVCVNVADLLTVRNNLGRCGSSISPPRADVNLDGCVNVADLLIVRNRMGWGCCR